MEHRRSKLALFLVAQALAVGAMILLLRRDPQCHFADCERSSAGWVMVAVLAILGELWILSRALRADGPVWPTVLAFGLLALIAAPFAAMVAPAIGVPTGVVRVAAAGHLAAGALLVVTGAAASIWELLGRLRRSDDSGPDERGSSAMWPLD